MALSLATLTTELKNRVFEGDFVAFPAAGAAWAKAYRIYAQDAVSCLPASPIPATLDAAESVLAGALATAFAGSLVPGVTATAMDPAFVAFWFAVSFGGNPPIAPPGVIGPALAALWGTFPPPLTSQVAADTHAAIFDTWTRTVVVSHPPLPAPPTCALPIT